MLFSLLKSSTIISILNILLLEKSLIVCGSNNSLVSSISTGIVTLLSPFHWAGAFIPITPITALDILQAPVPFIVGYTFSNLPSDISPSAAILNIDEVISCRKLRRYRENKILKLPEVSITMPINSELQTTLDNTYMILSQRLSTENISNIQLSYFLNNKMSMKDINIIRAARKATMKHNRLFCGDISTVDSWKKYGLYNPSSNDFEFFPQWFLDHQKSILEFQMVVANTQLFYAFVDKSRIDYHDHNFFRYFFIYISCMLLCTSYLL
jgi:hypothetical protein